MSPRAARFTQPPTKANRFAWAGCWIRHQRPYLHPRSHALRSAVCGAAAAPPACPAAPLTPNASQKS